MAFPFPSRSWECQYLLSVLQSAAKGHQSHPSTLEEPSAEGVMYFSHTDASWDLLTSVSYVKGALVLTGSASDQRQN